MEGRALTEKRIRNLLKYVKDIEGLLGVVQQYAAEGLNEKSLL